MDSIERVEAMNEKEALPPIYKKLCSLRDVGHLDKEMCEDLKVMTAGYFLYREGVEIMGPRGGEGKKFMETLRRDKKCPL